jgi:hypothetical protein
MHWTTLPNLVSSGGHDFQGISQKPITGRHSPKPSPDRKINILKTFPSLCTVEETALIPFFPGIQSRKLPWSPFFPRNSVEETGQPHHGQDVE